MANPIITENLNTGSNAWIPSNGATTQIQCYVDKHSYNAGDTITLYVTVQSNGTTWTGKVFRLGYYQGLGARLIASISVQTGVAQGYFDPVGLTLNSCPTAYTDATTGLVEARLASSVTIVTDATWITGSYIIQLVDVNGKMCFAHFVMKGNTTADYLVVRAAMTDCAYNNWGGKSLYVFNSSSSVAAVKVSFDRPDANNYGSGQSTLAFELNLIKWLELQGYNLSYITDLDMHITPAQLNSYRAVLIIGHNEYWTREMRDGMEASIASGVSAGFMSANICYWVSRMEASALSVANRTLVCYRSTGTDPQYGVDNTRVTVNWRSAPVNRPENTMMGIMYSDFHNGGNAAWTTDASMDTTYTAGSGLIANTSYGSDLVGYEWDKIQSGGPGNLKTIATTGGLPGAVTNPDTSNTTTYKAPSGALVFACGSVGWTQCLDPYRYGAANIAPIPGMQVLMANIMGALKGPVYGSIGH